MRISRIYTDAVLEVGRPVTLDEKASHYIGNVLRQKAGNSLILFNGNGHQYQAIIEKVDKKQITAQVHNAESPVTESPLHIHLGIAMSKGDRMDWVLQKSTELGVSAVTPLITERTELKLKGERLDKKLSHWRQILISACEQCERNILPVLHPPVACREWSATINADNKFVLHHRSDSVLDPRATVHSVAVLIGPEGGLTEIEIADAEQRGFKPLTLGPRVLRTETAPLATIAVLQSVWGDFN